MSEKQAEKLIKGSETHSSSPEEKDNVVTYQYEQGATDLFNPEKDDLNSWIKRNKSRMGEAIINPKNGAEFRGVLIEDLNEKLLTDDGFNYAMQLAYVAKYGTGEYQQRAQEIVADSEKIFGKLPDIVDPAREAKKEALKVNEEIVKKAAREDYKVLNDIFDASLSNALESPLESMPKGWYQTSNELMTAIEAGEAHKVTDVLRRFAQESDLAGLKLTLEMLAKYGAGEITNANAPQAAENAQKILIDLSTNLSKDIKMSEEAFDSGDVLALNRVIGFASVAQK